MRKSHSKVNATAQKPLATVSEHPEAKTKQRRTAMKYDLSKIMSKAWEIFRKYRTSFSEALHRAWNSAKAKSVNADRIEAARRAAGCHEDARTWKDWQNILAIRSKPEKGPYTKHCLYGRVRETG